MSVRRYLEDFYTYLKIEKRYSGNTLKAYRTDLEQFADFLCRYLSRDIYMEGLPEEMDVLAIRGFVNFLHKENFDRSSIARKLATLRSFFRFLCRQGHISRNFARAVRTPRQPAKLPRVMQQEEVDRLLDFEFENTPEGLRDRAIFELLYASGLRVGELASISLAAIDWNARAISITGKGNKQRLVFYGDEAARALEAYRAIRSQLVHGTDPQFFFLNSKGRRLSETRIRQILNQYVRKVALQKKISPHVFRHTFATHLLNSGADLRFIQELLGHSSLSTTQKYTHLNLEQLLDTYRKSHPRK